MPVNCPFVSDMPHVIQSLSPASPGHALIHASTASTLGIVARSLAFISLADGSDCVLAVTVCSEEDAAAPASLALTPAQQHNLHAKEGISISVVRFTPPTDHFSLVDVELEACLVGDTGSDDEVCTLNAAWAVQQFLKSYLGLIVAVNEACVFQGPAPPSVGSADIVLRVRSCNTLEADEAAETVGYHCFRGVVAPQTTVYITGRPPLHVADARPRPPPGSSPHLISVLTNDGECFPVHRKLLRPCIALTKAVRTPGEGVEAAVNIDTCTFDRVLIFLEALHTGGKDPPSFGIHHVPDLQRAAESLQLSSLADWAARRLGDATARCRWHSFDEIRRRNDAGECLLTMDGMVFDVTAWLAEHPGGSKIIPSQALNIDSSRFFELYHASRESFIYLREFYRGEVLPGDCVAVPRPPVEPSDDFMRQLREWTADFRLEEGGEGGDRAFKSF